MIDKLREIRFLWSNGMKYTGILSMMVGVATLIGVWFKDTSINTKIILIGIGTIASLVLIIGIGYFDYAMGFMQRDVSKAEAVSPMWIKQMEFNQELLKEIRNK